MRQYRADNREKLNAQDRARAAANPGYRAEARRRYRENNREKLNAWGRANAPRRRLRELYGLSLEQWARMLEEQRGLCYLCDELLDLDSKRAIHVDHDHGCCRGTRSCGACVRGLACNECNLGIGRFGDDPDRMERAAARLRAAKAVVAARKTAKPVQDELPIELPNVTPLRRDVG